MILDRTGLAIVGEGQGAAVRHGGRGRRGWKKLHLGVGASGGVVAQVLAGSNVDGEPAEVAVIKEVLGEVDSAMAERA